MRVGLGYDVHKLTEGRDLILGGVKIPYEKGLLGHSDADVLLHAIMDALLGAAALGDIGKHFPDTDERYRGISSMELLKHVGKRLLHSVRKCFRILNRCGKISRRYLDLRKSRSISRQRRRRGLDLPEAEKGSPLRQSVQSRVCVL